MSDPRACDGCGMISVTAEYIKVYVTNGALRLCRQCLDDINRKNPELATLRAEVERLTETLSAYKEATGNVAKVGYVDGLMASLHRESAALAEAKSLLAECKNHIASRRLRDAIDAFLAAPAEEK